METKIPAEDIKIVVIHEPNPNPLEELATRIVIQNLLMDVCRKQNQLIAADMCRYKYRSYIQRLEDELRTAQREITRLKNELNGRTSIC